LQDAVFNKKTGEILVILEKRLKYDGINVASTGVDPKNSHYLV
jgi:hypothetical protein